MLFSVVITGIALTVAAYLAWSPPLVRSQTWKATVTPLASIMGSGFLVSAPLLAGVVGNLALVFMAALLALAYSVGSTIRFNIRYFEPVEQTGHGPAQEIAFLARIVLLGAYFVSVSYYLQLLAAFVLRSLGMHDPVLAHSCATGLLVVIGTVGIWRGLGELELVERYAVSLNLGVIAALLIALVVFNLRLVLTGHWTLAQLSPGIDLHGMRVVLGLLIVVQGFETSRYLGDEHPAELRVKTMRLAQILSSVIYLVFIGLATVLFRSELGSDVTAIINMTTPVAVVLPVLLSIAAIGSQFSAAVADNAGAGGLLEDISHRRLSLRYAYLLIFLVTVALTWQTDVNQIIAYASRAFALFYALQGAVAFVIAKERTDLSRRHLRLVFFALISGVCLLVFLLGLPSE